jgi:hypothetical protein
MGRQVNRARRPVAAGSLPVALWVGKALAPAAPGHSGARAARSGQLSLISTNTVTARRPRPTLAGPAPEARQISAASLPNFTSHGR